MAELGKTELAVRIEAVSWFVLHLAAELEMANVIDGSLFSRHLREADWSQRPEMYLRGTGCCIERMVNQLDAARLERYRRRQSERMRTCSSSA